VLACLVGYYAAWFLLQLMLQQTGMRLLSGGDLPGVITYNHDFLTHLKICAMEMLALIPVKLAFLPSEQTKRRGDFSIERMLPNAFSGIISAASHILCL